MGGVVLADTINSYLVGVIAWTGFADLRDHAVWLMKRPGRLALYRICSAKARATLLNNLIIVSSYKRARHPLQTCMGEDGCRA